MLGRNEEIDHPPGRYEHLFAPVDSSCQGAQRYRVGLAVANLLRFNRGYLPIVNPLAYAGIHLFRGISRRSTKAAIDAGMV